MLQIQVDPYVNALDGTQSADIVKAKLHALPRPSEPHRLSTAPAIQILIARPVLRKPYNIIQ